MSALAQVPLQTPDYSYIADAGVHVDTSVIVRVGWLRPAAEATQPTIGNCRGIYTTQQLSRALNCLEVRIRAQHNKLGSGSAVQFVLCLRLRQAGGDLASSHDGAQA